MLAAKQKVKTKLRNMMGIPDLEAEIYHLKQVFSVKSSNVVPATDFEQLLDTAARMKKLGFKKIYLTFWFQPNFSAEDVAKLKERNVTGLLNLRDDVRVDVAGLPNVTVKDVTESAKGKSRPCDAIIIYDTLNYAGIYHHIGETQVLRNFVQGGKLPVVPYCPKRIPWGGVNLPVAPEVAVGSYAIAAYLHASRLDGHYCEFGTWFGRMFYYHRFMLDGIIKGKYLAFDSFGGLSKPMQEEIDQTGGDFDVGRYFCNMESFRTIGDVLGVDRSRVEEIPGYYEHSLRGHAPKEYGIEPRSVSIAYVDCDIYEPTKDVLEFLTEALMDGALLCFDDWFLNRASPRSGERRAVLEWLEANPNFELLPYVMTSNQNQWFIFNRK